MPPRGTKRSSNSTRGTSSDVNEEKEKAAAWARENLGKRSAAEAEAVEVTPAKRGRRTPAASAASTATRSKRFQPREPVVEIIDKDDIAEDEANSVLAPIEKILTEFEVLTSARKSQVKRSPIISASTPLAPIDRSLHESSDRRPQTKVSSSGNKNVTNLVTISPRRVTPPLHSYQDEDKSPPRRYTTSASRLLSGRKITPRMEEARHNDSPFSGGGDRRGSGGGGPVQHPHIGRRASISPGRQIVSPGGFLSSIAGYSDNDEIQHAADITEEEIRELSTSTSGRYLSPDTLERWREPLFYAVTILALIFLYVYMIQSQSIIVRSFIDGVIGMTFFTYVIFACFPAVKQSSYDYMDTCFTAAANSFWNLVKAMGWMLALAVFFACGLVSQMTDGLFSKSETTEGLGAKFQNFLILVGYFLVVLLVFYTGYNARLAFFSMSTEKEKKVNALAEKAKNFLISYRHVGEAGVSVDAFIEEFLDHDRIYNIARRQEVKKLWPKIENMLLDDKRVKKTGGQRTDGGVGYKYKYVSIGAAMSNRPTVAFNRSAVPTPPVAERVLHSATEPVKMRGFGFGSYSFVGASQGGGAQHNQPDSNLARDKKKAEDWKLRNLGNKDRMKSMQATNMVSSVVAEGEINSASSSNCVLS